jgi:hypothetical protein
MGKCNINSYVIPIYFMFDITHLLQDTGCFLKNAANRSSVIYYPILINKRSNTMVKKNTTERLNFFSTLTVMSDKCHFVLLNRNKYLFIFILVENFFLILMMPIDSVG